MVKAIKACYSREFEVLDKFKIEIKLDENLFNLDISYFFNMGCRINKKRNFLFVSKVLGKHISSNPKDIINTGYFLSALYIKKVFKDNSRFRYVFKLLNEVNNYEELREIIGFEKYIIDENTLIISFAETATALGHMFFNNFKGNIEFIHTTREDLRSCFDGIDFKEEHSHAVDQVLYPVNIDYKKGYSTVVLVDDEFTTGTTCLNIIKEIHSKFKAKKYVLVSILDWRSKENISYLKTLEKELNCAIECICIFKGSFNINNNEFLGKEEEIIFKKDYCDRFNFISLDFEKYIVNKERYCIYTGRFGLNLSEQEELNNIIKEKALELKRYRKKSKTLVLGTEEFMYIPLLIANEMGEGVYYHSTTRSPIYCNESNGYPIKSKYPFVSPYDLKTLNYVYNVPKGHYDEVFIIFERTPNMEYARRMLKIFSNLDIENINLVVCDGGAYGKVREL